MKSSSSPKNTPGPRKGNSVYGSALALIVDNVRDEKNDGTYTLSLDNALTLELWRHIEEAQDELRNLRAKATP